jgi:hypothetical protein
VAVASSRRSDPGDSQVSGLAISSQGAPVTATPALMARDRPWLVWFSSTLAP